MQRSPPQRLQDCRHCYQMCSSTRVQACRRRHGDRAGQSLQCFAFNYTIVKGKCQVITSQKMSLECKALTCVHVCSNTLRRGSPYTYSYVHSRVQSPTQEKGANTALGTFSGLVSIHLIYTYKSKDWKWPVS